MYVEFAKLMDEILKSAVDHLGYLALVQVRAKKIESFSTKIIKKDKYQDPLNEMTDLCGARVIVHFQSQILRVCEFIKENFVIDEANSLDVRSRLKVNEFGYRSIHYIVTPKKDTILGLHVDDKFMNLKAEIQIRTLAEHVWADISHDRIYKTELNIPEEWSREAARLSAILESADITFASMSQKIDAINNVYELQLEVAKAKTEIQKLKTLIKINFKETADKIKNVLSLVSVYRGLNMTKEAGQLLTLWIVKMSGEPLWETRLKLELVLLNLTTECNNTDNVHYNRNVNLADLYLKRIEILNEENPILKSFEISSLHYRFGSLLQSDSKRSKKALKEASRALELMPDNPLYFSLLTECTLLQNLITVHQNIFLFKNALEITVTSLEELIDIGIDGVPAWFAVGRCHFFLGNKSGCINAYSSAVSLIINEKFAANLCIIEAEILRADKLKKIDRLLAEQIKMYLQIALSVTSKSKNKEVYRTKLRHSINGNDPLKSPIVIVAGGASMMDEAKAAGYSDYVKELMSDFKGTIISGGTTSGIPGLVGRVKSELTKKGNINFKLLAYLPEKLPSDAEISGAYDKFYYTRSDEFSALDILNCWCHIIGSGINPADLILVGIDGGVIAAMEYRIALSLGAKVCLIAYSGRAVSELVQEKKLKNHPDLIHVPDDPLTLWAIVNRKAPTLLKKEEINKLAPDVHEFYRRRKLEKFDTTATDINNYKVVMEWEKLDPSLQFSNRQQVAFYQHILKKVNLGIRRSGKPVLFNMKDSKELSGEERDMLARLEHARWNAERLLEGWRYGPRKDIAARLNPCITAWDNLDYKTRSWDYEPVDNIPLMLEKIGYEVYRPTEKTTLAEAGK